MFKKSIILLLTMVFGFGCVVYAQELVKNGSRLEIKTVRTDSVSYSTEDIKSMLAKIKAEIQARQADQKEWEKLLAEANKNSLIDRNEYTNFLKEYHGLVDGVNWVEADIIL